MKKILLVLAHPQYEVSQVNRAMTDAAKKHAHVTVHDLYEAYPDFHIDIKAEQALLLAHDVIVLQYPLQWYACPALLKEWIDLVFERGWAYADGLRALGGKPIMCAISAGGPEDSYRKGGYNKFPMTTFLAAMEQTARLCHMPYEPPVVFYDAQNATDKRIKDHAGAYGKLLARMGDIKTPSGKTAQKG